MAPRGPVVLTCGHSNRSLSEFLALLRAHGITRVVDIRRYPSSRRHPQFSRDTLSGALAQAGIAYLHEEALGGHREPRPDSTNTGLGAGWLRGYADHVATEAFRMALGRVVAVARDEEARGGRVAVACAEKDPANCHRQILADALVARGARVLHVVDETDPRPHDSPRVARFQDGTVSYPEPPPVQPLLDFGG
jgi:uncharacterized protein (DUF488 family)